MKSIEVCKMLINQQMQAMTLQVKKPTHIHLHNKAATLNESRR